MKNVLEGKPIGGRKRLCMMSDIIMKMYETVKRKADDGVSGLRNRSEVRSMLLTAEDCFHCYCYFCKVLP